MIQQAQVMRRSADGKGAIISAQALTDALRGLMRQMAGTVAIIATEHEGQWHGMAATSVVSLCMEPPALLFCVNRSASIYQPLLGRGAACINLLSREQSDLCGIFSGKEKGAARFQHGTWTAGHEGLPCLEGALGHLFVRANQECAYGTHGVFSGALIEATVGGGDPLVYLNGGFAAFA
jgi:flavin reductase (DIM6/NTAB) family NADH-FMN oxidoreductase RutF